MEGRRLPGLPGLPGLLPLLPPVLCLGLDKVELLPVLRRGRRGGRRRRAAGAWRCARAVR